MLDLTVEEVAILREQLLARASGTSLVFPTKTGRPWCHFQFLRLVFHKARDADSGQLLDRIYDVGDRRARMRKAIDALAPQGLRVALAEPTPQPSDRPTAEGSTNQWTR